MTKVCTLLFAVFLFPLFAQFAVLSDTLLPLFSLRKNKVKKPYFTS